VSRSLRMSGSSTSELLFPEIMDEVLSSSRSGLEDIEEESLGVRRGPASVTTFVALWEHTQTCLFDRTSPSTKNEPSRPRFAFPGDLWPPREQMKWKFFWSRIPRH
jgi:hypothetical protein